MGDAPQQQASHLNSLFGGGDDNDEQRKRVDDNSRGLFHEQKSHDLHAKLRSTRTAASVDQNNNNNSKVKKQAGGMRTTKLPPPPSHTVETTKSRAAIVRFRTECARHPKVKDLMVERNVHEPLEAFC
jgi:hypothetical protein